MWKCEIRKVHQYRTLSLPYTEGIMYLKGSIMVVAGKSDDLGAGRIPLKSEGGKWVPE